MMRLKPTLQKIESLIRQDQWFQAKDLLKALKVAYPTNIEIARYLVEVSLALGDDHQVLLACEHYVEVNPKDPKGYVNLFKAYYTNQHLLLAQQTFQRAQAKWPNHSIIQQLVDVATEIQALLPTLIHREDLKALDTDVQLELLLLHEQGQAFLHTGRYSQARAAESQVLQRLPSFAPSQNNLSLVAFVEGQIDEAISLTQGVLEQDPDNLHALSNIVRYYCVQGELDQAYTYHDRLKNNTSARWDPTKQIEGLSYLGDDQAIVDLFEQLKAADEMPENPFFYHLVAVALARQGKRQEALEYWEKALDLSPGYRIALANLADQEQLSGDREGPWAFELTAWIRESVIEEFRDLVEATKNQDDSVLREKLSLYLNQHPEIEKIVPVLLERGDLRGRQFAGFLASLTRNPALLSALKTFALSQWGSDQSRMEAFQRLSEAGVWTGEPIQMWRQGKWTEIMPIGFELSADAEISHSPQVTQLYQQSILLLREGKAAEAEALLLQAIELEPTAPDLKNNLAAAYHYQDRRDEAEALVREIASQFPTYGYGQISLAKLQLMEHQIEAAESTLQALLTKKHFHYDEFGAFSDTYLTLLTIQDKQDAARSWLQLWQQTDPDSPLLWRWLQQLEDSN